MKILTGCRAILCAIASLLAWTSCGEGELSPVPCFGSNCGPSDAGAGDGQVETDGAPPVEDDADPTADTTGPLSDTGSPPDVPGDVAEGAFGYPCRRNEDCLSRICILGLEGTYICTELCRDDCDEPGYACQFIESTGGDLVQICYPQVFDLCKPCDENFECGGLADNCLDLEDGRFCGADCQLDGECPDGFDCRSVDDAMQCMPESNFCSDCFDRDDDGYGVGSGCLGSDCADLDNTVFQGAPELCDFKDNDCDLSIDEDIDVTRDPNNCGGCGRPCTLPHAINICVDSTCFIDSCEAGWYDLDPEVPGCDYECVDEDLTIPDIPDPDFMDTNCDGIDGDIDTAIFVSAATGHPEGDGSLDDPVDEIWRGIELAAASGGARPNVLIAQGTYSGRPNDTGFDTLELTDGINLFGGYESNRWQRSDDNVTLISGNATAVRGEKIESPTIIANLTIQADAGSTLTSGTGGSSIALLGIEASGLNIVHCVLRAGDGGSGGDGEAGQRGRDGENGGMGSDGNVHSGGVGCAESGRPSDGTPGPSPCAPGGVGGGAGRSTGGGGSGGSAGLVAPGGGGTGGGDDWINCPDMNGGDGDPGCSATSTFSYCNPAVPPVLPGPDGSGGNGVGSVDENGFWHGDAGDDGEMGMDGYGGGGGGGGGGGTGDCSGGGFFDIGSCCDGYGGSGGGGGGGGCGGGEGEGGGTGGGSFGLYLIDSTPTVTETAITSRAGGRGGNGGGRGDGGDPGSGQGGGGSFCNGGSGGRGGDGTAGGDGGAGGGGGGGVSYAVYLVDSSDAAFTDVETNWGLGGPGGTSDGNEGLRGESGSVARITR